MWADVSVCLASLSQMFQNTLKISFSSKVFVNGSSNVFGKKPQKCLAFTALLYLIIKFKKGRTLH